MKLGQTKLIRKTVVRIQCDRCEEVATNQIWFCYENGRNNPASSMYRRDDCTYCSDETWSLCDKCHHDNGSLRPNGMYPSAYVQYVEKNPNRFLKWKEEEVKEQLASDFLKQFAKEQCQ